MNTIKTEGEEKGGGQGKDTFGGEGYQRDMELIIRKGGTVSQAARLAGNLWEARNFGNINKGSPQSLVGAS